MRTNPRKIWHRLVERQDQWSLQTRLILAYVLIMLIPSIIVSIILFQQFAGSAVRDAEKKNENALAAERKVIESHIETMIRTARLTVSDEAAGPSDREVLDYLVTTTDRETSELIEFNSKRIPDINRLKNNNPSIERIHIFFGNPMVREMYPVLWSRERVKAEPWYNEIAESGEESIWYLSPKDLVRLPGDNAASAGRPRVSLIQKLQYPLGHHAGILKVDMLLSGIFPGTFGNSGDDQSQMFLYDRSGRLFYNEGQLLIKETGASQEALLAALNPTSRAAGESFRFTMGGKPFIGIAGDIEQLGVRIVNVVSLEDVLRNMNRTRNQIIAANVILIAILSVATYFLNALILKRLHVLIDSMKKARKGDFHFDLRVRGGGEVGELAHHYRKMLGKINELIADAVNKKAASKETELKSLKNQIDSHFLYNTLENIKMMAEIEGNYQVSDALTSLGGLMRYNLKWTSEYVRLRDEVNHITNYIAIMNVRYERRVKLVTDIPPAYMDQELLKMSLQPIVENAVKHGMDMAADRELTITIRAWESDGAMTIAVTDDGIGMTGDQTDVLNRSIASEEPDPEQDLPAEPEDARQESSGIGLRNVHRRIRLYYGKEHGLSVESKEGQYTSVLIHIPYFILTGGAA